MLTQLGEVYDFDTQRPMGNAIASGLLAAAMIAGGGGGGGGGDYPMYQVGRPIVPAKLNTFVSRGVNATSSIVSDARLKGAGSSYYPSRTGKGSKSTVRALRRKVRFGVNVKRSVRSRFSSLRMRKGWKPLRRSRRFVKSYRKRRY